MGSFQSWRTGLRTLAAFAALLCTSLLSPAFAQYPMAELKNNTEYTVSGTVAYASAFCSNDKYSVGPGSTWRASSRGVCLITGITGTLSGVPASLRGSGMTSFGEKKVVTPYESSGTAYAKFQINAYGDRYRIFSENEWAKESNTGQGRSPGFRFVNYTAWPISISFDQVGCLYYGVVPAQFNGAPGEFRRDTGAVWFTIRAHIQPDAINPQTDWQCMEPVVELVGDVALAAMSGGSSVAASGAKIAAKQVAKAAIKSAARKAVKEVAKFGAKQLGEYLTTTSSIMMPGQYAGYAWPFQCSQMPEYHITGGPEPIYDEYGTFYIEEGPPLRIEKVNQCGNDMMLASPKSERAEEIDSLLYFDSPAGGDAPTPTPQPDYPSPLPPVIQPPQPNGPAPSGDLVSLRSINFPDHYVRHQNFMARISPISSDVDRKDATFRRVAGFAGGGSVSFESVNFPGHFLRHQNYMVMLHPNDGSPLFGQDASFYERGGLAGGGHSYEAVNFAGHYVRHQNFEVKLHPYDGTQGFQLDASFELTPALDGAFVPAPVQTPQSQPQAARKQAIEAGPIWNQADAEQKCPQIANQNGGRWTGGWWTTVQGAMSVCEIEF